MSVYRKSATRLAGAFVLVGGLLLLSAAPAQAALVLRLTEGAATETIVDQSMDDANPAPGAVTFIGAVGAFTINVSTGLSKPVFPNTPTFASMDLNSVNTSNAPGTLLIELTDTDFVPFPIPGSLVGDVGGTTQGTVQFWAYKDPENQEFGESDIALHLGPFTAPPVAFAGSDSIGHGPLLSPYSMTLVAEITHGAGVNSTSFDFQLANVPEPALMTLFAVGLFGAGVSARRRLAGQRS